MTLPRALWLAPLLLAALFSVSILVTWYSVKLPLRASLSAHMPAALADAVRFSVEEQPILRLVSEQIDQDLQSIQASGRLPLLRDCRLSLSTLDRDLIPPTVVDSNRLQQIRISWMRGGREIEAEFVLQCHWQIKNLLGLNLGLGLLALIAVLLLPAAAGERELSIRNRLLVAGFEPKQVSRFASQAVYSDDPQGLLWLDRACQLAAERQLDLDWVARVTLAENTITFDHDRQQVSIHGVTLTLPKTPYFYYALYAWLRQQGEDDGWLLNPSPERPDHALAAPLITLMQAHGGHRKAINELLTHGIRGKLLDQNRNKIKDELTAVLGELLAADYLFESERDLRTGRYRYRLQVAAASIRMPASEAGKKDISFFAPDIPFTNPTN